MTRSQDAMLAREQALDALDRLENFYRDCIGQLERNRSALNEPTHAVNLARLKRKIDHIESARSSIRSLLV